MSVRDVVQAAAGVGGGGEYVEDVFSTYLGNADGSNTIVNGIDLSTYGGMVWHKTRSAAYGHDLRDSARGFRYGLEINTGAQFDSGAGSFTANTNGFSDNYDSGGNTDVWWTFRKAPKFFDVVTWTGDGVPGREIPHNLGSVPGCIIVKNLELGTNWIVYHQGANGGVNPEQYSAYLDATNAFMSGGEVVWGDGTTAFAPTSTHFTIYSSNDLNRASSLNTYVAYLFAHNAGGFGNDGEQNVISCGSYTTDGSGYATVNLGYEPQWVFVKASSTTSDWYLLDTMRGMSNANPAENARLYANTAGAETSTGGTSGIVPTATGFNHLGYIAVNATFIYIAIRRPMKTPESGTSVFTPDLANAAVAPLWEAPFPVDLGMYAKRDSSTATFYAGTRLTGTGRLSTWDTAAEVTDNSFKWDYMNGWFNNAFTDSQYLGYSFRRAPGFFDVVGYTGTGGATTFAHNLAAVPELMISKNRSQISNWAVYHKDLPLVVSAGPALNLDRAGNLNPYDFGLGSGGYESPTSSVFTVGPNSNSGTDNFVAYLFASCPGVSKVGSYTGTGADLNVDCGFSAGARFVLIKRTDSSGDWYVWDSARGIVSGNDPYLLLNSTAAEEPNTDYIDPLASGFTVTSNASSTVNVDTGTYIFLAIA
jgi:hypothetical protein